MEVLRTHIRLRLELFCLVTQLNDFSPRRFETDWPRWVGGWVHCIALPHAVLFGIVCAGVR